MLLSKLNKIKCFLVKALKIIMILMHKLTSPTFENAQGDLFFSLAKWSSIM